MAEASRSTRSSVEPSSNPSSPSSSSPLTTPDQPKKRTRASKPKVRTGCITWIRRVKCDEGKPACLRCTSTGRTCDGYDKTAVARYRPADQSQTAELARAEFVRACEWNEALRSMRRIEASIDGTETEKRLFARFRAATADGAAAHLCNFTSFWRRLTPSTGCKDEAIKHAVVALAAAYQLFQYPNEPVIDGFTRSDLEVFTIQQYNRSIERLQNHAAASAAERIRVTLVCCLAFISLETLRGNHDVAVTHLINGLRILQSLPDAAFDGLADGSLLVGHPTGDSLHMADIIQLFAQLELSSCFFTRGIQPVISDRGYHNRRLDDGASEGPFPDAARVRIVIACFLHDAMARLHELAVVAASGDEAVALFWSDPAKHRQQACLQARCARLNALVAEFFSPARFGSPDPTTPDLVSLYLDLLYFRCAQFLVAHNQSSPAAVSNPYIPDPFSGNTFPTYQIPCTAADPNLFPSILHLASRLSPSTPASSHPPNSPTAAPRGLTDVHTRLLGPLYLAAVHALDGTTRSAAGRLLARSLVGPSSSFQGSGAGGVLLTPERMAGLVQEVVSRARAGETQDRGGGSVVGGVEVPRALVGAGCLPLLWDALGAIGGGGGGLWEG